MITFKEYITEARSAPLYHATRASYAKEIIEYDLLRRGASLEPGLVKRTISLTRNLIFAKNWIDEQFSEGVIFELDQAKLSQRYKIIPYNYFGQKMFGPRRVTRYQPHKTTYSKGKDYVFENQFEEAVLTDIKNISKYITKVYTIRVTSLSTIDAVNSLKVPVETV